MGSMSEIANLQKRIGELEATLLSIADKAEASYWESRHFIDTHVKDWTHGDDSYSYPFLAIAKAARNAAKRAA
jgi:enoyl-[acyl-carrier-protein] reductase (NADH)